MKYTILLVTLLFSSLIFSQTLKKRTDYIKKTVPLSNSQLKMVVLDDNNQKESTETGTIDQLKIPETKRFNIQYDTKIQAVKQSDLPTKLNLPTRTTADWKVVPEILSSKAEGSDTYIDYQIYFTSVKPFKYDPISQTFNGKLGFVLVDISDGSLVKNLSEPAYIEVNSDEIDEITPEKLSVNHLSLPSSEIVMSEKNGSDSLKLKIITKTNLAGYDTYIKVEPTLNIRSEEKTIMSFGVEKAHIDVRMIGSSLDDSVEVRFSALSGNFTPDHFKIKNNELKRVELYSGYKIGDVNVSAIGKGGGSENYESNTFVIHYTFPWLFIAFSMAGGIIGGILRYRKKIKLKKLLLAMVDGLAACIIYFVLKIPIPQIGELDNFGAVIFGIGLLGGLITITNLFPYIKSLMPSKEPKPEPQNEDAA